jgi:hypothetical protein
MVVQGAVRYTFYIQRSEDEINLLSASSAFAAKNYPGGRATHYLYGIPVDEYNFFLKSSVGLKSDWARLLHAGKCHVIDEIGGLHFEAFDCADRLMRLLTGRPDRVWGGQIIITVGDFRQVCSFPVNNLSVMFNKYT